MDIQQLRQSLKLKWLSYYEQNRLWLVKMRVWGTYDGLRRPSSGFILATLSILEPQFNEILTFILDLNNNPDRIIAALGLNFNPDQELLALKLDDSLAANSVQSESLEEKFVPAVAVTKVNHQSSPQGLDSEQPPDAQLRTQKPVLSLITLNGVASKSGVAQNRDEITNRKDAKYTFAQRLAEKEEFLKRESLENYPANIQRPKDEPVPSAVATVISPRSAGGMPHSIVLQHNQPVRSPAMPSKVESNSKPLALLSLATNTTSNHRPVRSLLVTDEVPVRVKTLPLVVLTTDISRNGKISKEVQNNGNVNIQPPNIPQKVNLLPSTNARSLASWVDEFCQGTRWEPRR